MIAVAGQREVVLYHSDTLEELGVMPFPKARPIVCGLAATARCCWSAAASAGNRAAAVAFDVKTGGRVLKVGDELDAVLARHQ